MKSLLLVTLLATFAWTSNDSPAVEREGLARGDRATIGPTVNVERLGSDGLTRIRVQHPDGIGRIDWRTFRVEADGVDITPWLLGLVRSSRASVALGPQHQSLTITTTAIPPGLFLRAWACLIGGPCAPVEQLLRDGSGYPDPQHTNGHLLLPMWESTSTNWEMTAVRYSPTANRTLTRFRGVVDDMVDGFMSTADFNSISWTLNVFGADSQYSTPLEAFDADARHGNLVDNMPLTLSHSTWSDSHLVYFVPSSPLSVSGSQEYWFSVRAHFMGGAGTQAALRHSSVALQTDYYRGFAAGLFSYESLGIIPGVAALDIFGY